MLKNETTTTPRNQIITKSTTKEAPIEQIEIAQTEQNIVPLAGSRLMPTDTESFMLFVSFVWFLMN